MKKIILGSVVIIVSFVILVFYYGLKTEKIYQLSLMHMSEKLILKTKQLKKLNIGKIMS